jgi:hypothetical protein
MKSDLIKRKESLKIEAINQRVVSRRYFQASISETANPAVSAK